MTKDHQAIVPPWAGRPWCTCGYVGGNGIDRPLLADHLRKVADHLREIGPAPCPTCSGPIRETVDMVCQTCGTDYARDVR